MNNKTNKIFQKNSIESFDDKYLLEFDNQIEEYTNVRFIFIE